MSPNVSHLLWPMCRWGTDQFSVRIRLRRSLTDWVSLPFCGAYSLGFPQRCSVNFMKEFRLKKHAIRKIIFIRFAISIPKEIHCWLSVTAIAVLTTVRKKIYVKMSFGHIRSNSPQLLFEMISEENPKHSILFYRFCGYCSWITLFEIDFLISIESALLWIALSVIDADCWSDCRILYKRICSSR